MIFGLTALALLVTSTAPRALSYGRDVAPVFARQCVRCHGPAHHHGGLRLDGYEEALRGGDSGPAIITGNARDSLLIQKLEHRDRPPMPPRKRLSRETIATIRSWIDQGTPP